MDILIARITIEISLTDTEYAENQRMHPLMLELYSSSSGEAPNSFFSLSKLEVHIMLNVLDGGHLTILALYTLYKEWNEHSTMPMDSQYHDFLISTVSPLSSLAFLALE